MIQETANFTGAEWVVTITRSGSTVTRSSEDKQCARIACYEDLNERLKGTHAPINLI